MVVIQAIILTAIFIYCGAGSIRRHSRVWRSAALVLAVFTIAGTWSGAFSGLPAWTSYVLPLITQGALAGMLFAAVMYAAAVPDGCRYMRTVMPIRGELSILASILTLGHNIAFGKTYFVRLFTGSSSGTPLAPRVAAAAVCSLIMIAIMIPLFITSFPSVRRRMKPKRWKKLQRAAYLFYALMYVHILLLNLRSARMGHTSARINVVIYSIIFVSYGVMRLQKALRRKKAKYLPEILPVAGAFFFMGVLLLVWWPENASVNAVVSTQEEASTIPEGDRQKTQSVLENAEAIAGESGAEAAIYAEDVSVAEAVESFGEVSADGYIDGTYTGSGEGYNGTVSVKVTITDGKISGIKLKSSVDDEPYITDAQEIFPLIIEAQSTDVDASTGATMSTKGLKEAVAEALTKAVG